MIGLGQRNLVVSSADDSFYVSYNAIDAADFGDVTTALVYGQMSAFYVLNGNHLEEYKKLIPQGWEACFSYFKDHKDQWNFSSDTEEPEVAHAKFTELMTELSRRNKANARTRKRSN